MDIYETNFFIMMIDFTEFELETIANAMEDYIQYDDEKLDTESLFGGLSVSERVHSILEKIDNVIMQNPFTEIELETIANAMDDYINYDDENLNTESLFGGLSVADRVNSIQNKIDDLLKLMEVN